MGVNKKLTLKWKGEKYSARFTMGMIDDLEESINLMKMMNNCMAGDIRYSHAAKLVSLVLNQMGAETTQEEIFFGMFEDEEQDVQPLEVVALVSEILDACFYKSKKNITVKQPAKS